MASKEPRESEAPEPKKERLNIPMRDLWAHCNALNAAALFVLARILCGEIEVQEKPPIQTDLRSAYYLAQTAGFLAQSQATKKEIDAFIERLEKQKLREQNLEGTCKIFPDLGLQHGFIHGALSARTLHDNICPERQTVENEEQKRERGGGFSQPSKSSETNLHQERGMNEFESEGPSLPDTSGKDNSPPEIEMDLLLHSERALSEQGRSELHLEAPENKSVFGRATQFVKDHPEPFIILGVGLLIGVALATPVVGPVVLSGFLTVAIGIKIGAITGGMAITHHAIGSAMIGVGVLASIVGCVGFFGRKTSEQKDIPLVPLDSSGRGIIPSSLPGPVYGGD